MNILSWQERYRTLHSASRPSEKRPLIAIAGNFAEGECRLAEAYYESVLRGGGMPVVLPPVRELSSLPGLLDRVDGVLLSGGADLNPLFLGEEPLPALGGINARRDEYELQLIRLAYHRQIPILGICRGVQMMVAALGGDVWQDLSSQYVPPMGRPHLKHAGQAARGVATHTVRVEQDSLLSRLLPCAGPLPVNSFHHQAVREPGPHLRVCATAPDGVIEAIESCEGKAILGVQWHPECFLSEGDDGMLPLFAWLSRAAEAYRRARALHSRVLSLDSHCDTPMLFSEGVDFGSGDDRALVDLPKMRDGGIDAVIMAAYLPQGGRTDEELLTARTEADTLLSQIEKMVMPLREYVELASTPQDLGRIKACGKKAVMRAVENGYALGRDLRSVAHFRRRGVVYVTLCHNGDNDICDSASRSHGEHGGLSPFGREVVEEMNRVGMMIDLSHAGRDTFSDVLSLSSKPVVCSHSSAFALCPHPRNLTDAQLHALAERGGVAQVTCYHGFLREEGEADIDDVTAHLMHMIDVAGVDHVGIGSDFDGDGGVRGLASAEEYIQLTLSLLRKGFGEDDLEKIWGGNFLRVMQEVQDVAPWE